MKINKIISLLLTAVLFSTVLINHISAQETTEINNDTEINEENQNTPVDNTNEKSDETVLEESVLSEPTASKETQAIKLASNELVVYTYAQLSETLESSTDGIDTIYLGADISLSSAGIWVSYAKTDVTIDGTYDGVKHTLTEAQTTGSSNTIYINESTIRSFTLKNMNIVGGNFYGTVYVRASLSNVTLNYDNIYYRGPQLTHNISGNASYKDSTIEIVSTGTTPVNEIAEISNVDFYGKVDLIHNNSNHLFLFYGSPTLTFHENAIVNASASGGGMFYDRNIAIIMKDSSSFTYNSTSSQISASNNYISSLLMEKNSSFYINYNGTSAISQGLRINGNVTLNDNARLDIKVSPTISDTLIYSNTGVWTLNGGNVNIETNSNVTSVMRAGSLIINSGDFRINNKVSQGSGVTLSGGLTVEENGSYYQYSESSSAYSFNATGTGAANGIKINGGTFHIETNTATAQYLAGAAAPFLINPGSNVYLYGHNGFGTALLYMSNATANVVIDDPNSLVFYNTRSRLIQYVATQPLNIKANQINIWPNAAFPGSTMWDESPYYWNKQYSDDDYYINGNLAAGTGGNYTFLNSNYEANDGSTGNPATQFSFNSMRVLSAGRLSLEVDSVFNTTTAITGKTIPNGVVLVEYEESSNQVTADDQGYFSSPISNLKVGDNVKVTANDRNYLYQRKEVLVEQEGGLSFKYVPDILTFHTIDIPSQETIVNRQVDDWSIQVEDERTQKTNWKLFARLDQQFVDSNQNEVSELKNSLIFIDSNGISTPLSSDPLLIHENTDESQLTNISWSQDKGILAKINPGALFKDVNYNAKITWILQDAP